MANCCFRDDGGEWKCQLSYTDGSVVKAEDVVDLTVAFEAEVNLEVTAHEEDQEEFTPGDNITVR